MKKTIIIAEAGVNHNGDMEKACQLIDAAANAGADYVKFQSFKTEKMTSAAAKMADYQKQNLGLEQHAEQFGMLKKLEISRDQLEKLKKHASDSGIKLLSTPFDIESLDTLKEVGVDLWKVASGELTNRPLIEKMAATGLPIVVSTGMATLDEVKMVVKLITDIGLPREKLTILHCTTNYPTPYTDVNLIAMNTLERIFGTSVGYSDHTLGVAIPVAAVARGASIIEKHFTLDRNLPGPDHKASLEPDELKQMVESIRQVEQGLGYADKKPGVEELKNRNVARKSIHFKTNLPAGHVIQKEDFIMLRPGSGISAWDYPSYIGRALSREVNEGDMLHPSDVES
jgi:N-acetylneuraminate synthase/N,N'-diacetyllegionaminate synthase